MEQVLRESGAAGHLISLISIWGPMRLEERFPSSRDRAHAPKRSAIPLAKVMFSGQCMLPKPV